MSLPFGKKVYMRHFCLLKTSKSLSKREVAMLRKDIPAEVSKHLQRGSLPYIKVSAISGIWATEFVVGTSMYYAFDNLNPEQAGDHLELSKKEMDSVEAVVQLMFADATLVGDGEYVTGKMRLRDEYIKRESERRNKIADEGKTEEELRKENEEAVQEVADRDKHAATILEMGEHIKEGGE